MRPLLRLLTLLFALGLAAPALAQAPSASEAQVAWRLLDYVAVDYAGAVADGEVVNPAEYGEMIEFSTQIRTRLDALPANPAKAALMREAEGLQAAIRDKADPAVVGARAKALAGAVLTAYPSPLAPSFPPDLARGAALYAEQCAVCHGVTGRADGPGAEGLDPPAIAFADVERARQRSVFGLYQVIDQGLEGTAMASFSHLPAEDRWALAFYVGRFAFTDAEAAEGKRLWDGDPAVRAAFPDLAALTQTTPAELATRLGEPRARALTAYLRRHPEAAARPAGSTLTLARTRLAESEAAYRRGDRKAATDAALSAYLDGVEPIEPALGARDSALLRRVETAMTELRVSISRGAPAQEVAGRVARANALLDTAERALAPQEADNLASFLGAFTILLREGLETPNVGAAFDQFLAYAGYLGEKIGSEGSAFDPSPWIVAAVVFIVGALACALGFGVVLVAKLALALLVALGPIFIACALFDATRRFFFGWLSQAVNYLVLFALIITIFQLVLALVRDQWGAIEGGDPMVGGLIFIALCLLGAIFFLQTPAIAAGIAGGASAGLADFANAASLGSSPSAVARGPLEARRFRLTPRCVVWDLSEVQTWLEKRRRTPVTPAKAPDVRLRRSRPVHDGPGASRPHL